MNATNRAMILERTSVLVCFLLLFASLLPRFSGAPTSEGYRSDEGGGGGGIGEKPAPTSGNYRHTLSWDTHWVTTGRTETSTTTISIPYTLAHHSHHLPPPSYSTVVGSRPHLSRHSPRAKRLIFGSDDRIRVDPSGDGQKYPFSAVVRVSTGCSGVLVSERHVLTAAHCLHDGSDFLKSALLFLRVGYLGTDGRTNWRFARRFFVSSYWKNATRGAEAVRGGAQHQYSDWDDYDFAVIELGEDLGKTRGYIKPGMSALLCSHSNNNNRNSLQGAGSAMQYVSFPDDKSREALWYTETNVTTESPQLLYFTGDAWHGSSGAGLYAWNYDPRAGKYERRVVAVLSGNRNTEPSAGIQGNFNVAARLTAGNLMQVCRWIGTEKECAERYEEYLDARNLARLCGQ